MKKLFSLMVFSGLIFIVVTACGKQIFDGSRTGNDDQFIMEYTILNKTETHEMKLDKGIIINVNIVNKSGRLDVLVVDKDGEELYRGDNADTGKFSLEVPKTAVYKFSVSGKEAKGSVSFKVAN